MKNPQSAFVSNVVYQHNHLIRQPLNLSPLEIKIFLLALRCVRFGDTELPAISIPLSDVMPKADGGKDYAMITAACKNLLKKQIQIIPTSIKNPDKKQKWHEANILGDIGIDPNGIGMITGTFSNIVKPYLIELKGNFAIGEIAKLLAITNPNTYRLYWIFKSYDSQGGGHHFQLDDLKMWLFEKTEQYDTFFDFKRYVLDPAMKTFAEMNWGITWAPVKTGKKVTGIKVNIPKFVVKVQDKVKLPDIQLSLNIEESKGKKTVKPAPATPVGALVAENPELQKVASCLKSRKLSEEQICYLLPKLGTDELSLKKFFAINRQVMVMASDKKITNEPAYMYTELKRVFNI
jgi:plasmid replication initiation protein